MVRPEEHDHTAEIRELRAEMNAMKCVFQSEVRNLRHEMKMAREDRSKKFDDIQAEIRAWRSEKQGILIGAIGLFGTAIIALLAYIVNSLHGNGG